jgi:hypothetical protein
MIQPFEFEGQIYIDEDQEDNINYVEVETLLNTPIKMGVGYTLLGITLLPATKTCLRLSKDECSFIRYQVQKFDHVIHLLDGNSKIMVRLIQEEGECYSGWNVGTFVRVQALDTELSITYRSKTMERVAWILENGIYSMIDLRGNEIVQISVNSDRYYPSDYYSVNLSHFELVGT